MAAAEYYIGHPPATTAPQLPYQQPQRPQPPQYYSSGSYPPSQFSPQYSPALNAQQEIKPSVHFADQTPQKRPPRQSFTGQAPNLASQHRPSLSNHSQAASQHLRPYIQNQAPFQDAPPPSNSYPGTPPHASYPPGNAHMAAQHRPYTHGNLSEYSLNSGSYSDPEQRRRRHRKHEHKDSGDRDVKERPRKHRSRSSNADGLIGAAGGGLIGDLIFPGLGTVGGALVGWLGGKNYANHRKHREDKLEKQQYRWEERFGHRHHSDDGSGYGRRSSEY